MKREVNVSINVRSAAELPDAAACINQFVRELSKTGNYDVTMTVNVNPFGEPLAVASGGGAPNNVVDIAEYKRKRADEEADDDEDYTH